MDDRGRGNEMIRLKLFYAVTWYLHGQEIRTLYQAAEIGDLRGAVAALDKGADVNLECLVLINYMFSHIFFHHPFLYVSI